jgi:hypothetical protein
MFVLQISKWIRTLFTKGNVAIDLQLLKQKEKEIKKYLRKRMFIKTTTRRIYRNSLERSTNNFFLMMGDIRNTRNELVRISYTSKQY